MRTTDIKLNYATKNDCKNLWIWRNHPQVRRGFFNDKPIPWQEHKKWFYSKIRDKNTKIYIARQGKAKVGVIRFGIERDFITVSVNLNPRFFGKRLGSEIIRLGSDKLFKTVKIGKPIIAEIKKDNVASHKAFTKAGYKVVNEKGKKIVYKREIANV